MMPVLPAEPEEEDEAIEVVTAHGGTVRGRSKRRLWVRSSNFSA